MENSTFMTLVLMFCIFHYQYLGVYRKIYTQDNVIITQMGNIFYNKLQTILVIDCKYYTHNLKYACIGIFIYRDKY